MESISGFLLALVQHSFAFRTCYRNLCSCLMSDSSSYLYLTFLKLRSYRSRIQKKDRHLDAEPSFWKVWRRFGFACLLLSTWLTSLLAHDDIIAGKCEKWNELRQCASFQGGQRLSDGDDLWVSLSERRQLIAAEPQTETEGQACHTSYNWTVGHLASLTSSSI